MKEVFDNWRQFVESAKEKPLQEQTLPTLPGEEGPPSANEPVVLRPPKYRKDRRKSIDRPKTVTKYIENLYNATIKPLEDWYLSLEDLDERIAVDILDPIGFTDIPDLKEAYAEYSKWNDLPIGHPEKDPLSGASLFVSYIITVVLAIPGLDLFGGVKLSGGPKSLFSAATLFKIAKVLIAAVAVLGAAYVAHLRWTYIQGQPVQLGRGLEYYKTKGDIMDKETADLTFGGGVQPTASRGGEVGRELDGRYKKKFEDMRRDINLIMQFEKELSEEALKLAKLEKDKNTFDAVSRWRAREKEKEQKKEKSKSNPVDAPRGGARTQN